MNATLVRMGALLAAALIGSPTLRAESPETTTAAMAAAAQTFLKTLSDEQRAKTVFEFSDQSQRQRWSNLPSGMYRREGVRLADLTPAQRAAAAALLRSVMSPGGYEKVMQMVESDEVLRKAGGGGGSVIFGRDEFFISFLGQPTVTSPWMLQFGGHHLALNVTVVGDQGTLAPSLTATQPAIFEFEGKTVKPLGRETEKSFALFSSLDEAQRKQALLGFEMRDLVLGPGRDGQTIQPEGIKGANLTERQRQMLLDLAREWTGILPEAVAAARNEEMRRALPETWFAWSGPTNVAGLAYFRIQGPTVIIEYAPQRLGGDPTQHIHTIYRDPTNDYGVKWWKR